MPAVVEQPVPVFRATAIRACYTARPPHALEVLRGVQVSGEGVGEFNQVHADVFLSPANLACPRVKAKFSTMDLSKWKR